MLDLAVIEFKEKLIALSNESKLPLILLNYIFQDVTGNIQKALEQQIMIQKQERDKQGTTEKE